MTYSGQSENRISLEPGTVWKVSTWSNQSQGHTTDPLSDVSGDLRGPDGKQQLFILEGEAIANTYKNKN